MRELDTNNHSAFAMYYHLVLVVRYRRKVINEDVSVRLQEIFENIQDKYNITLLEWNHDKDHIHTLSKNDGGKLVYPNLSTPAQADFEIYGMGTLEGYGNEISKVAYEMNEDGVLGDGRVVRNTINKNDFKINNRR